MSVDRQDAGSIILGGKTVYGQVLGVLMLETAFPRIPGDVGHAATWPFPVRYLTIPGAAPHRIMGQVEDRSLLEPFIEGARQLESDGVRAITTSCGFLAVFQPELADAVRIPVMTSALLQVPLAAQLIGRDQVVAVLTERPNLTERHFRGAGVPAGERFIVSSFAPEATFPSVFIDGREEADFEELKREIIGLARSTIERHPSVGAFVLECTNFGPFSEQIRGTTGLPVFDLRTLVGQALAGQGVTMPS